MQLQDKIVFIGGGQMAEALLKGILQAGLAHAAQVKVVEPVSGRRDYLREAYGVEVFADALEIAGSCNLVILAVKPQVMAPVLTGLRPVLNSGHLLISIAAGIPLAFMEGKIAGSGARVIRVMPNTPALVLAGASALSGGQGVSEAELAVAKRIFEAIGIAVVMAESYLDAVTGVSGSGPAYVFSFIEAMIDGALKVGLNRGDAELLVHQTILGSVQLAMATKQHPGQLRAMVTSPGGTTIAGQHELARAGFAGIVMDAIEAGTRRSRELGQLFL